MTRKSIKSIARFDATNHEEAPEERQVLSLQPSAHLEQTVQPTGLRFKMKETVVPAARGYVFRVKASQHFRIVDLHGQQVVDFMAWRVPYSPSTKCEHFSTSYTRYRMTNLAPPRVGEYLYSNRDRPMFKLTADTVKTHDLLFMACNPSFYARDHEPEHRSCATNVLEAMQEAGYEMDDWNQVHDPFNVFQNTPYYSLKGMNSSRAGDYLELRAETDAVVAVSCCPYTKDGFNGGKVTDIAVLTEDAAITIWGGMGIDKIATGTCHDNQLLTCYAFYPASKSDLREDGWNIAETPQLLTEAFSDLDPDVRRLMLHSEYIKMWKTFEYPEYPYWHTGKVCLIADAAHPIMPDNDQGYSMAAEDAGALGLIFSPEIFGVLGRDINVALALYEKLRKERVSVLQEKSLRARTDIRKHFGLKSENDPPGKLTVEWLCEYDMRSHLRELLQESRLKQSS